MTEIERHVTNRMVGRFMLVSAQVTEAIYKMKKGQTIAFACPSKTVCLKVIAIKNHTVEEIKRGVKT